MNYSCLPAFLVKNLPYFASIFQMPFQFVGG